MYQNIVKNYFDEANQTEYQIFDQFFQKKIEKQFSDETIKSQENDSKIQEYLKDFVSKSGEIAKLFSILKNKLFLIYTLNQKNFFILSMFR